MTVPQENISLPPVRTVSLRSTAVRGAAISAALVAALGLAACGSSDDEKSPSADNTQSASVGGGASATAGQTSASAGDATGATAASGGSGSATGGLSGFIATASTHGYNCVESPDPFLKKDGITCSPSGSDALNRAVFALFDRSVVASGEKAAEQAGSSLGSDAALTVDGGDVHADDGEGNSVNLSNIPGLDNLGDALGRLNAGPRQFRPLDSGEFAGYCLDSLGNCQASGLDAMGLTLG